mgnify:FL=1
MEVLRKHVLPYIPPAKLVLVRAVDPEGPFLQCATDGGATLSPAPKGPVDRGGRRRRRDTEVLRKHVVPYIPPAKLVLVRALDPEGPFLQCVTDGGATLSPAPKGPVICTCRKGPSRTVERALRRRGRARRSKVDGLQGTTPGHKNPSLCLLTQRAT